MLKGNSGATWGAALKSTKSASNPIIVSIGNRICLETALKIVKKLTKFRVPEPIRLADKRSRFLIADVEKNPDKYKFDKISPMTLTYDSTKDGDHNDSGNESD